MKVQVTVYFSKFVRDGVRWLRGEIADGWAFSETPVRRGMEKATRDFIVCRLQSMVDRW